MKTLSPRQQFFNSARKDIRVMVSLGILLSIVIAILVGPYFTPDPQLQNLEISLQSPSWSHLLGTDDLGRDLLSRILSGGRLSLAVGLVATFVSIFIGTAYGCISGYFGGKLDQAMMRWVDILYCMPYMFIVIILMIVFGRNILVLFVALGLVQWLTVARIVRGQVLSLKTEEFILAAKCFGVPPWKIMMRHLLPNVRALVIVYATLTVPAVILQESFLSFLGLNVHPCTWGVLISDGATYLDSAWWLVTFPGVILSVSLLSLNFLGDGLRDLLDKKLQRDLGK